MGPADFPYVPLQAGVTEEMAADFMLFCMASQSALTPPPGGPPSGYPHPHPHPHPPGPGESAFGGGYPAFPDFSPSWFRSLPGFPTPNG